MTLRTANQFAEPYRLAIAVARDEDNRLHGADRLLASMTRAELEATTKAMAHLLLGAIYADASTDAPTYLDAAALRTNNTEVIMREAALLADREDARR